MVIIGLGQSGLRRHGVMAVHFLTKAGALFVVLKGKTLEIQLFAGLESGHVCGGRLYQ